MRGGGGVLERERERKKDHADGMSRRLVAGSANPKWYTFCKGWQECATPYVDGAKAMTRGAYGRCGQSDPCIPVGGLQARGGWYAPKVGRVEPRSAWRPQIPKSQILSTRIVQGVFETALQDVSAMASRRVGAETAKEAPSLDP